MRCRREIADTEAEILAGNSDLEGLCLARADWSSELRLVQNEKSRWENTQRRKKGEKSDQALTE